jgi:hypothetical protein
MRKGLEAWEFFDGCRWRGERGEERVGVCLGYLSPLDLLRVKRV